MNLTINKSIEITSNFIAEFTGKKHDKVMRDIREQYDDIKELGYKWIRETTYINSRGKEYPNYTLTQDGLMLVITGYSVVHRTKLIEYCRELEKNSNNVPKLSEKDELSLKILKGKADINQVKRYEEIISAEKEKEMTRNFFEPITTTNLIKELGIKDLTTTIFHEYLASLNIGTFLPYGEKGKRRYQGVGNNFNGMITRGYARIKETTKGEVVWNKLIIHRLKKAHNDKLKEFVVGYDLLEY